MAKISKERAIAEIKRRQELKKSQQGFAGIGNDLSESWDKAPGALMDMVSSIPEGINKVGDFATSNNPITTMANLGAGAVESGAGLISSPQILMRYLAQKFPEFGKKMEGASGGRSLQDPTFYEGLMNFEKNHGLEPRGDEASVRNAGGLVAGGGVLKKLPGMLARGGAVTAESAGRGGDPLHAALMSLLGEQAAKLAGKGINKAAGMNKPAVQEMLPPDEGGGGGGGGSPPPGAATPPALQANIQGMPSTPGYMNTISNIPAAAKNMVGLIPKASNAVVDTVKNSPMTAREVGGQAVGGALDLTSKALAKLHLPGENLAGSMAHYIKQMSVDPEVAAKRILFEGIDPEDLPQMQARSDAMKRLGMDYATPAELLPTSYQGAKQGNLGLTSAGSKLLEKKALKRFPQEESAIIDLQNKIYDPKDLAPEKKAAYETAMAAQVPPEFVAKWSDDPIVSKVMKQIDSVAEYKRATKGMDKDSFAYWNYVKRIIGDREGKNKVGMEKSKSDENTKLRNEMVADMDNIQPEYKVARKIAEREFTRKDIEKFFDRRNMTGAEFTKYIKSKKGFNELMDKLEPYPEAQQQLLDMQEVFGDLINETPTARSGKKMAQTGMDKARNPLDAQKFDYLERHGKKHDVALVNLATDPEFMAKLTQYLVKKRK